MTYRGPKPNIAKLDSAIFSIEETIRDIEDEAIAANQRERDLAALRGSGVASAGPDMDRYAKHFK